MTITDPNMTRFMMTIDDAVDLVLYAFTHGEPGDTFVQKAPSATIETLALALKKLMKTNVPVTIIGTRHGEKLYESLISREEMVKAEDMGGYYRIPADNRDLNYSKYYEQGEQNLSQETDYTSENTERLDVDGMVELLLKLDYIQAELKG